ncbi:MAG: hypothetical protein ACRCXD_09855 [Luteolibacter sp.]
MILSEDAFIKEIGKIRSELGEIQEIYDDFQSLTLRIMEIRDDIPGEAMATSKIVGRVTSLLTRALGLVEQAEEELLLVSGSPKKPRRNPPPYARQGDKILKEMERISYNIGMLSVRIRNIGQATSADDIKRLQIQSSRDKFEKASEIVRQAFVAWEKILP